MEGIPSLLLRKESEDWFLADRLQTGFLFPPPFGPVHSLFFVPLPSPFWSMSDLLFRARLAEYASRWEEMAGYMKTITTTKKTLLSTTERQMLAVAYKNVIAAGRGSWRSIYTFEVKSKSKLEKLKIQHHEEAEGKVDTYTQQLKEQIERSTHQLTLLQQYRLKLQRQTEGTINEIVQIVLQHLIPSFDTHLR